MALHTFSAETFPLLRGRRTRLRAPRADDAAALASLLPDAEGYLVECAEHLARGDRIDWIVTTHRDDDAIGTCTLYDIDPRTRYGEVGYALVPFHRGRGHATDAVTLATDWAMRALRLERIDAQVEPDNYPSQRVLLRAGFACVDGQRWTRQPR